MANDQLFKSLCRPEIMRIGWHLAQGDSRDDFIKDPIQHADYSSDLTKRLLYLIEEVQSNRYRPKHLIEVDVPKTGLSVRPGNVLPIEEASVLHSVVYLLAPKLDNKLDKSVYSYRLHTDWKGRAKKGESMFREVKVESPFLKKQTISSISPFEAWYELWPAFENDARDAVERDGYTYLTKTDIASYFENIDLRLLEALFRSLLKTEEKIIQLLFSILNGWTRPSAVGMPVNRGIPQGNEVSSFLGNIYLIPLDGALIKFCKSCGAKWFRYVDDVKVFTRSEADARKAVFIINQALREIHLNLQGSKTEILSGDALHKELDETKLDKVNNAHETIRKLCKPSCQNKDTNKNITSELRGISGYCKPFTNGLPEAVRGLKGKENRLFRRLLATYGIAGRSRKGLIDAAYHAICELPDLRILRSCLSFYTRMDYKTHTDLLEKLFSALEKDELLFPYQIASVLEATINLHPASPNLVGSRIRKYAFGTNLMKKSDWSITQKAIEALMSYPYNSKHAKKIFQTFVEHDHPMVRRSAVMFLTRSDVHTVHTSLNELVRHPDHGIARLSQYLNRICSDYAYSEEVLSGIRRGSMHDNSLVRRLPQLYAASASSDPKIANILLNTVLHINKTQSAKLKWHYQQIQARVNWVKTSD